MTKKTTVEIKSKWFGKVLFTHESTEVDTSLQLREAVIEAVKQGANLSDANLSGANLGDANLRGAYLRGANLRDANLGDANLRGAYLRGANLRDANLRDANLGDANLGDAYLRGANLSGANLSGANLRGANLSGAKISWSRGNRAQIKSLDIGDYDVAYSATHLAIGCMQHEIEWWMNAKEAEFVKENGQKNWNTWKKHKSFIKKVLKDFPAELTGKE